MTEQPDVTPSAEPVVAPAPEVTAPEPSAVAPETQTLADGTPVEDKTVPYERFKEVNEKATTLQTAYDDLQKGSISKAEYDKVLGYAQQAEGFFKENKDIVEYLAELKKSSPEQFQEAQNALFKKQPEPEFNSPEEREIFEHRQRTDQQFQNLSKETADNKKTNEQLLYELNQDRALNKHKIPDDKQAGVIEEIKNKMYRGANWRDQNVLNKIVGDYVQMEKGREAKFRKEWVEEQRKKAEIEKNPPHTYPSNQTSPGGEKLDASKYELKRNADGTYANEEEVLRHWFRASKPDMGML